MNNQNLCQLPFFRMTITVNIFTQRFDNVKRRPIIFVAEFYIFIVSRFDHTFKLG